MPHVLPRLCSFVARRTRHQQCRKYRRGSRTTMAYDPVNHILPERTLHNTFLRPADNQYHMEPFTLLILNYELPLHTLSLWHQAFLPDVILGDLDSLRPGVCDAYTKAGVQVVSENCQDSTDLQKCLAYASRMLAPEAKLCPLGTSLDGGYPRLRPLVIAVGALTPTDESTACVHYTAPDTGALGGRLDHTIANLASLTRFPHLRVVLMGDGNLAQVVPPGRSIIVPVPDVEGPTCGLVPLFGDVECTTEGLEWDLHAQTMSMTGLISTSNRIVKGAVHVQSNAPLLWTVEWSCGAQNR